MVDTMAKVTNTQKTVQLPDEWRRIEKFSDKPVTATLMAYSLADCDTPNSRAVIMSMQANLRKGAEENAAKTVGIRK